MYVTTYVVPYVYKHSLLFGKHTIHVAVNVCRVVELRSHDPLDEVN